MTFQKGTASARRRQRVLVLRAALAALLVVLAHACWTIGARADVVSSVPPSWTAPAVADSVVRALDEAGQ